MVRLNNAWTGMKDVLCRADVDYSGAHKLVEDGVISKSLGGFLKTFVHMKSCLNMAILFSEDREEREVNLRLQEAELELREICRVYNNSFLQLKHELAEHASDVYTEAHEECRKIWGEVA